MAVPDPAYLEVVEQRDSLGRAAARILRQQTTNGFGLHYIPSDDIDRLRRAHDRAFKKQPLSASQAKIMASFKRNSRRKSST